MTAIEENDAQSALIQLRAYLAQQRLPVNSRLPPERELCRALGVTRTAVRNALATLEAEGQLWRHVGKGTFVGTRKPRIDELERQRMLDQILTELLARASGYGFTLDEVLEGLRQRKEPGS